MKFVSEATDDWLFDGVVVFRVRGVITWFWSNTLVFASSVCEEVGPPSFIMESCRVA